MWVEGMCEVAEFTAALPGGHRPFAAIQRHVGALILRTRLGGNNKDSLPGGVATVRKGCRGDMVGVYR